MSANAVKCHVFVAASSTGGKVWGYPIADFNITRTFFGTKRAFEQGSVSTRTVRAKASYLLETEKKRKGYHELPDFVWVDFDSGQVWMSDPNAETSSSDMKRETNIQIPEEVMTISQTGSFNF